MHVVEPDGEALGAEPEGLQALPLGPRREESEPSAIPNGGGQILTHVDTEILRGCDIRLNEHVVVRLTYEPFYRTVSSIVKSKSKRNNSSEIKIIPCIVEQAPQWPLWVTTNPALVAAASLLKLRRLYLRRSEEDVEIDRYLMDKVLTSSPKQTLRAKPFCRNRFAPSQSFSST